MMFQFESGHGAALNNVGLLRPLFGIAASTRLYVNAGEESTDAPEPSIYLETVTRVTVRWFLHATGPLAPHAAPARASRRGASADTVTMDPGVMVGRRVVTVNTTSVPLLASQQFKDLKHFVHKEDKEKEKKGQPTKDWQALLEKYVAAITDLHHQVRARSQAIMPTSLDDDPLSDAQHDPQLVLQNRVAGLFKNVERTNMLESYSYGKDEPLVAEGLYELQLALEEEGIELESHAQQALLTLPLLEDPLELESDAQEHQDVTQRDFDAAVEAA